MTQHPANSRKQGKENNMTRLNNIITNNVTTDHGNYIVLLERLKNTPSGNPRFDARVISPSGIAYHFHFHGHYYSELDESKWIVGELLKIIAG